MILSIVSLANVGMIALMALGFGFIIFWHELGHFLAAKAVGIRVEQFAVGFGNALVSWRKGVGVRFGNTQKDYRGLAEKHLLARQQNNSQLKDERIEFTEAQIVAAADELGLGQTEYRLNWIPLGGYVKMLGQDDLRPDAVAEDPNAYNKKSVSARMLVISAGVIMNIILAAIGFMILFTIGFKVPPAWVGGMLSGSPVQLAVPTTKGIQGGLKVGDRIISMDGKSQDDWTKITLNTALSREDTPVAVVVDRPTDADATKFDRLTFELTPMYPDSEHNLLAIGLTQPYMLQVEKLTPELLKEEQALREKMKGLVPADYFLLNSGDVVVAVNGSPVQPADFIKFDRAVQSSAGKPVVLTVQNEGKTREVPVQPHFEEPFDGQFSVIGCVPRVSIQKIQENSPMVGKLAPGDIVTQLRDGDPLPNPTRREFIERLNKAGELRKTISLDIERDGKKVPINDIHEYINLDGNRRGLGLVPALDEGHAIVGKVMPNTPAAAIGLQSGDKIVTVGGKNVTSWFDVYDVLRHGDPTKPISLVYERELVGKPTIVSLKLTPADLSSLENVRFRAYLPWSDYIRPRIASNLGEAAVWGVRETRDFILQFYVTLRRMFGGSISPSNMMGPVGIFVDGSKFALRGTDWLIWFLAMISANLAVVNFLPIPVVDGGQFMFLLIEKIKGKPLSPKAMAFAQYVGLAFLAAVVIFVTYYDIRRHI